jgi:hypothetical protein
MQVFTVGVTVMVAVIGAAVVFVAVKPEILPVPLTANPIDVLLLVQVKVPPVGILTKFVVGTGLLLQTSIFTGRVTVGVGFIVMVLESAIAEHPPEAVMVLVTV